MRRLLIRRAVVCLLLLFLAIDGGAAFANPYLAKSGDVPIKILNGACAITGGFINLYAALDNRIFGQVRKSKQSISSCVEGPWRRLAWDRTRWVAGLPWNEWPIWSGIRK